MVRLTAAQKWYWQSTMEVIKTGRLERSGREERSIVEGAFDRRWKSMTRMTLWFDPTRTVSSPRHIERIWSLSPTFNFLTEICVDGWSENLLMILTISVIHCWTSSSVLACSWIFFLLSAVQTSNLHFGFDSALALAKEISSSTPEAALTPLKRRSIPFP